MKEKQNTTTTTKKNKNKEKKQIESQKILSKKRENILYFNAPKGQGSKRDKRKK